MKLSTCFQVSNEYLLKDGFNWLIWSTDQPSDMEHANLNVDSDVTWATRGTACNCVLLYDIYKVNYSWPVISTLAGQWDSSSGLVYTLTQFKYLRRADLRGLLFNAVVAVRRWGSMSALRALKATRKHYKVQCTEMVTKLTNLGHTIGPFVA
jgi:hypothetical protein